MWFYFFQSSSSWDLHKIIFDIIIELRPWTLTQWFLLTTISMTLTTYLNVSFFSTITINVAQVVDIQPNENMVTNAKQWLQENTILQQEQFNADFNRELKRLVIWM
ncbi:unnamed protein product [Adineta steineri]|uniref:Uncharacterized protein n=1 Tax=Adineta steineri TaxID=433720 RepID=A0A813PDI0_9BILA|nr:unnamed protein product [Adineta steineri]